MRRSRLGSAIVAAAVTCAAAACSFVTSLDGLTGGSGAGLPDSSSADDATADGANGADAPQPGDDDATGPTDGAVASDGGTDAGTDGNTSRFCASLSPAPLFCDDFDQTDGGALAVGTTWDQISSLNGAATLSQGQHLSSPDSMLVTTVGGASDYDCAAYRAFQKDSAKPYVYTFSFDVFVAQADLTDTSDAVLSAFQLYTSAGARYDLELEASYAAAAGAFDVDLTEGYHEVDGGNSTTDHPSTVQIPFATWTPVTLVLTIGDPLAGAFAANSAKWTIANVTTTYTPTLGLSDGIPEILVGLPYVAPQNTTWAVYFDNVTFDAQLL